MTLLSTNAQERSTIVIPVSFSDEAGNPVVPDAVTWTLRNERGETVNSRIGVPVDPAQEVEIILSGDDLDRADGRWRYLTTDAVYDGDAGNDLPARNTLSFYIERVP